MVQETERTDQIGMENPVTDSTDVAEYPLTDEVEEVEESHHVFAPAPAKVKLDIERETVTISSQLQ